MNGEESGVSLSLYRVTALLTRRFGGGLAAGGCSAATAAGERLHGITNPFAEPLDPVTNPREMDIRIRDLDVEGT